MILSLGAFELGLWRRLCLLGSPYLLGLCGWLGIGSCRLWLGGLVSQITTFLWKTIFLMSYMVQFLFQKNVQDNSVWIILVKDVQNQLYLK